MPIKRSLGKFGSRFTFELFIEIMHGPLIQGLKKYLSSISVENIPGMVRKAQFPPVEHLDFSAVRDSIEHIEKISLLRFVEFIAEVRPDLVVAIQDTGQAGAEYMVKLRDHLLDKIRQPDGGKEFKTEEGTVLAHCDQCDKRWPVKREEGEAIAECPFCGAGTDQKKEELPEDE